MFNSLLQQGKIKSLTSFNFFIWTIKNIPGLQKLVPKSIHRDAELALLVRGYGVLKEISDIFFWRMCYVLLLGFSVTQIALIGNIPEEEYSAVFLTATF